MTEDEEKLEEIKRLATLEIQEGREEEERARRESLRKDSKYNQSLSAGDKWNCVDLYSKGTAYKDIAKTLKVPVETVKNIVQKKLREMNTIRETNDLKNSFCSASLKLQRGTAPTKFLTSSFLSLAETNAEVYAYYFAQTGDNTFALLQSGLDVGIAKTVAKLTKEYVYRIRGQFLRDIPSVATIIKEDQERKIEEYTLEKPQIQMELVKQIEELKLLVHNKPQMRNNLLKAIEMLGRTIGAFTDRVEYEETDARSGLEILMKKAKKEVNTGKLEVYEQE